jgi:hypothetical protein
MENLSNVFVFNAVDSAFPLGIFSTSQKAISFITTNKLSGTLTKYPIDMDIYHWTITNGFLKIKSEYQKSPKFIEKFSSAYLEHWHIENGIIDFELD